MQPRISIVTLGVKDLERSIKFYEGFGWKNISQEPAIAAFNLIGMTFGLYPWSELAADIGIDPGQSGNFPQSTLAHNVSSPEQVDTVMLKAKELGAAIVKPAQKVFWGGYSGYFTDLDGHYWEIAHNPFSPLGKNGEFQWGGVVDETVV